MTDAEMIRCAEPGRQIERLRAIMHRLRAPGGCPWDAEQTHESLVSNLIEETYETVAAIRSGDQENLREELGDLLLQVVFHAELAQENDRFNLDEIARGISDKLVRRHPHVYSDSRVDSTDGVLSQWEDIKRAEKGHEEKPYLHGVGKGLPALLRAAKLQKKAGKIGFDWPDTTGIAEKIDEEIGKGDVRESDHVHCPTFKAYPGEFGGGSTRVRVPKALALTLEQWAVEEAGGSRGYRWLQVPR